MKYIDSNISEIIYMAWTDKISFGSIRKNFGVSEHEVVKIMRSHLKRSSFCLWRKRIKSPRPQHKKFRGNP